MWGYDVAIDREGLAPVVLEVAPGHAALRDPSGHAARITPT